MKWGKGKTNPEVTKIIVSEKTGLPELPEGLRWNFAGKLRRLYTLPYTGQTSTEVEVLCVQIVKAVGLKRFVFNFEDDVVLDEGCLVKQYNASGKYILVPDDHTPEKIDDLVNLVYLSWQSKRATLEARNNKKKERTEAINKYSGLYPPNRM